MHKHIPLNNDTELHDQILKSLEKYFFYKVSTSGSRLVRYIASAVKKPFPATFAVAQLRPIGKTTKSKPVYTKMSPFFHEEKEKFINSIKNPGKITTVQELSLDDILKEVGYTRDFSTSHIESAAARWLVRTLNNQAIDQLNS